MKKKERTYKNRNNRRDKGEKKERGIKCTCQYLYFGWVKKTKELGRTFFSWRDNYRIGKCFEEFPFFMTIQENGTIYFLEG